MNQQQLRNVVSTFGRLIDHPVDQNAIRSLDSEATIYRRGQVGQFIKDLTDLGSRTNILFLENSVEANRLDEFMTGLFLPILMWRDGEENLEPLVVKQTGKGKFLVITFVNDRVVEQTVKEIPKNGLQLTEDGRVIFLNAFSYRSLVSMDEGERQEKEVSPVRRLVRLLSLERKDIWYIYVYAFFIGGISLTLPLGIQAIINLIQGGVQFNAIWVLIALLIGGTLFSGILQIYQITLVEYIQRRIFAKAAFEFSFRVPRMKMESLKGSYAPELMNRFFDVVTLQKGLPKLLIDLSTGVLQIFFGLVLLSLYHPFFIFFGLFLVSLLVIIFYFTGPKGMRSSIVESKYKYKVVYWLEEMARTLTSFKAAGNTQLPTQKTDANVNNYLKNRRTHFGVLISQYSYILGFKVLVTGGLLIIGSLLVMNRQITLGQFVASEIIIILIVNSVEKIIMYMDVVYDNLTAVDKISHVTDVPLERIGGITLPQRDAQLGFHVRLKDLDYAYPNTKEKILKGLSAEFQPGEKVCLMGYDGAGKTTLINVLSGALESYTGIVTVNGYSLHDLDLINYRDRIAKNVSREGLFDGTVAENITIGKRTAGLKEATEAMVRLGMEDEVHRLPQGLRTHMAGGGQEFSTAFVAKIILARCLNKKPGLLLLNDFFQDMQESEAERLTKYLTDQSNPFTMLAVSNSLGVAKHCDRVVVLKAGEFIFTGTLEELQKEKTIFNDLVTRQA